MKWHRETSYRNSRDYGDDAPRGASVSQFRLTLAWLLDAARQGLEGMFGRGRPSDQMFLRPGNAHGFTVLGTAVSRHAVHESALTCPYPELDDAAAAQRQSELESARSPQNHSNGQPADEPSAHPSAH